jgi:hypothetical protein
MESEKQYFTVITRLVSDYDLASPIVTQLLWSKQWFSVRYLSDTKQYEVTTTPQNADWIDKQIKDYNPWHD